MTDGTRDGRRTEAESSQEEEAPPGAVRGVCFLMRGSKFRYRSARLHSLRLEMKLTEDDMPTADDAAG
jgi:hypothetical protein